MILVKISVASKVGVMSLINTVSLMDNVILGNSVVISIKSLVGVNMAKLVASNVGVTSIELVVIMKRDVMLALVVKNVSLMDGVITGVSVSIKLKVGTSVSCIAVLASELSVTSGVGDNGVSNMVMSNIEVAVVKVDGMTVISSTDTIVIVGIIISVNMDGLASLCVDTTSTLENGDDINEDAGVGEIVNGLGIAVSISVNNRELKLISAGIEDAKGMLVGDRPGTLSVGGSV